MSKSKDPCAECRIDPCAEVSNKPTAVCHCCACARTERRKRERLEDDLYRLAEWECSRWLYHRYHWEPDFVIPWKKSHWSNEMGNQYDRDDWYDLQMTVEEARIFAKRRRK